MSIIIQLFTNNNLDANNNQNEENINSKINSKILPTRCLVEGVFTK